MEGLPGRGRDGSGDGRMAVERKCVLWGGRGVRERRWRNNSGEEEARERIKDEGGAGVDGEWLEDDVKVLRKGR